MHYKVHLRGAYKERVYIQPEEVACTGFPHAVADFGFHVLSLACNLLIPEYLPQIVDPRNDKAPRTATAIQYGKLL